MAPKVQVPSKGVNVSTKKSTQSSVSSVGSTGTTTKGLNLSEKEQIKQSASKVAASLEKTKQNSRDSTPVKGRPGSVSSQRSVDSNGSKGGKKKSGSIKGGKSTEKKTDSPSPKKEEKEKPPMILEKKVLTRAEQLELGKRLVEAIVNSDNKNFKRILGGTLTGEILNWAGTDGLTPILMSMQKGRATCEDFVTDLVKAGANIEKKDHNGMTPLMWAAKKGYVEVVKLLLDKGADWEHTNDDNKTAFQLSIDPSASSLIKAKIDAKAAELKRLAELAAGTAIYDSVKNNDIHSLRRLVEASPHLVSWKPSANALTPLAVAVNNLNSDIVEFLLSRDGVDNLGIDSQKRTNLHRLCSLPRIPSFPTTKASRDKEEKRQKLIQLILKVNPNQVSMYDMQGFTPLMYATVSGYEEDLKVLLDAGADIDQRQITYYLYRGTPAQRKNNGDTCLVMATRRLKFNIIRILVEYGKADVNIHGEGRMTPFMWAVWFSNHEIMAYLVAARANVNLQADFGESALFWAVQRHHLDTIKTLLNYTRVPADEDLFYKVVEKYKDELKDVLPTVDKPTKPKIKKAKSKKGLAPSSATKPKTFDDLMEKKNAEDKQLLADMDENERNLAEEENKRKTINVDLPARNGATPFLLLCRHAQVIPKADLIQLAELFIKYKTNVNVISTDKLTPLIWAVVNQIAPLTKLLLENDADPHLKNSNGFKPVDLTDKTELIMMLQVAMDARDRKNAFEASARAANGGLNQSEFPPAIVTTPAVVPTSVEKKDQKVTKQKDAKKKDVIVISDGLPVISTDSKGRSDSSPDSKSKSGKGKSGGSFANDSDSKGKSSKGRPGSISSQRTVDSSDSKDTESLKSDSKSLSSNATNKNNSSVIKKKK